MDYAEARRQARALLGQHSDVEFKRGDAFPARVGVWSEQDRGGKRFVYVGIGTTFEEALSDAKKRQVDEE